ARGLYVLAIVSGLSDVDAITLSLARMGQGGLPVGQVVWGILLAASANNLVKTGLALGVGGRAIGRRVAGVLGAGLLLGLAVGFGVNGVP
ncbi:MAG TPA: hypothetical protein DDW89_02690, partial [Gammaproteobacteria bacterium]|nr:hypothetical protein [Gammaproteobacteria bacterium]